VTTPLQSRCARCRTPLGADARGAYCPRPCAVAGKVPSGSTAPRPEPVTRAPEPAARTVAAGPDVAQLRELVERLELAAARVEAARTVAARRKAPTVADAMRPADERALAMLVLGECVGAWTTAEAAAPGAGCTPQKATAILRRLAEADGEEHPDPLVRREVHGGRPCWRATAEGEKWIHEATSFDVVDGDEVARAIAREADERECGECEA
jgi:hypothetical protein